jgi:hypothetical protein
MYSLYLIGQHVYYHQDEYSKRLIGNAFSIPVIDIFMASLKSKFDKRSYKGYNYDFAWQK